MMAAVDDLKAKIAAGKVIVFCGAGVAKATSSRAPGWHDLLASGIQFLAERVGPSEVEPVRAAFSAADATSPTDLVAVGDRVERLLARREGWVTGWLQAELGRLAVESPDLIQALHELDLPMATTNYDRLIEDVSGRSGAVWTDTADFQLALSDPGYVVHVHGTFRRPRSVVLGNEGYTRVGSDVAVRELLEAQLVTRSAVFVGFGAGLDDPNLGRLTDWFGTTFAATPHEHYVLVRTAEAEALVKAGWPAERGVVPIGFGEENGELPGFVAGLAPGERSRGVTPLRNLPPRNLSFEGRGELLDDLRERLTSAGAPALTQLQALRGTGGIGKSQTALEYAHRFASKYRVAWWVEAENPGTIPGALIDLAKRLGVATAGDWAATWDELSLWFAVNPDWLLVFDNAPDQPAISPYVPPAGRGHVLVTSRDPGWPDSARLDVAAFTESEAVAFLEARLGGDDPAANRALAAELGRLPLVLEQAAAYILDTGCGARGYLDLYEAQPAELLARGRSGNYPDSAFRTFELSIEQSEKICLEAEGCSAVGELLAFCAYLDPDGVPINLLAELGAGWPSGLRALAADRLAMEAAIAALRRTGVLDRRGEALIVHRVVQRVVRHRLGKAAADWQLLTLELIEDLLPKPTEHRSWSRFAGLLPLALSAVDALEPSDTHALTAARIISAIGIYQETTAAYQEARTSQERALLMFEDVLGEDHPEVAITLGALGNALWDLNELEEARVVLERALATLEAVYGPEDPKVALTLTNLGGLYADLDELGTARTTLERALAAAEAGYGAEHPDVAVTLATLGNVMWHQGELDQAKVCLERALRILEAGYGEDDPRVATALTNLGALYGELGKLGVAKSTLERALDAKVKTYGANHPEVAMTLGNLGMVQFQLGDLEAAMESTRNALTVFTDRFGPDHPHTQLARANLTAFESGKNPVTAP